jgi:tRNA pseudouridine55 synthase
MIDSPAAGTAPCGILLLDKPLGLSSNTALQRVRHALGRPRAGHTGSLDPLATGMLPICVGEATKLAGHLLEGHKGYTTTIRLGTRTETGDREGRVIETRPVPALDAAGVEAALAGLRGRQMQVPPMYSALKLGGEPLYRLARRGISVERKAREISIDVLELVSLGPDELTVRVECSKGTYIRVLGEQIGTALGTCAHLGSLRRDFVEPFRAEAMVRLEDLPQGIPPLLPADRAVAHLQRVDLGSADATAIRQGRVLARVAALPGTVRLYDSALGFLGLGTAGADGSLRAKRLFAHP